MRFSPKFITRSRAGPTALRLRHHQDDAAAQAAPVHLVEGVGGVFVTRGYPQATDIFPQVVSCANQTPDPPTSDPDWQPTLRVEVEPVRGTPDESGSIGCLGAASTTTTVTSDDPSEARGLFTGVRVQGRLETRRSREDGRRRPPERGDSRSDRLRTSKSESRSR